MSQSQLTIYILPASNTNNWSSVRTARLTLCTRAGQIVTSTRLHHSCCLHYWPAGKKTWKKKMCAYYGSFWCSSDPPFPADPENVRKIESMTKIYS